MIEHFDRTAQPTAKGHSKPWRKDMQRLVAKLILSTKKSKGEMLSHVKQQLKAAWKGHMTDAEMEKIDEMNSKSLIDCVKSLTLKLLQMLQADPSKAASSCPNIDVSMLYRICRCSDLNFSFAAFCNYLRSKPWLKSMLIPISGIVLVIFVYDMYAEFVRNNKLQNSTFTHQLT